MYLQLASYCLINILLTSAVLSALGSLEIVPCPPDTKNPASPCYCKKVDNMMLSSSGSATAPKPKDISVNFENNNGQIHPRITWTVHAQYLHNISGFHLEVTVWPNLHELYKCNFSIAELGNFPHSPIPTWKFEFEECCQSLIRGTGLRSGRTFAAKVISLPLYSIEDEVHYVSADAVVPGFSDNKKPRKHKRQRGRKRKKSRG